MAFFNEIGAGRFNRALQKLLQLKGGPPARQLGTDIVPQLRLDDLMTLEHRILLGVRSWANILFPQAGGAGNRSGARLRMPVGSNVVAVVEKITIGFAAIDQPFITRGPTSPPGPNYGDLTTIVSPGDVRDVRMGPIGPAVILSTSVNTGAIVGTNWWQGTGGANSMVDVILDANQELVIGPGDQMTIYANQLNQSLLTSVFWRERALEESELAGVWPVVT